MRKSPNEPKEMKIKPKTHCAHGGYEASFEACFVDLECHEKQYFFQQCCDSRKYHGIAVNSHKVSPLGPISGLVVVTHHSTERFQSCNICSYDKSGCYYK